ncbi:hypothetical protein J4460_00975 [Candidatus Woesearchaeota archaeon]|nr:hypothetical protein [Candidatus Woesearchaeota archaeon]
MNDSTVASVQQWHEFHERKRSPFFSGIFLCGPAVQKNDFPFDHRVQRFGIFCGHVAIDLSEKERLSKQAVALLQRKQEYLLQLMDQAYKEHTIHMNTWKKNDGRKYGSMSNEEVAEAFRSYVDDLFSFGIYVTLPLFVEEYFESFIQERFIQLFGKEAGRWFGIAVNPLKDGTVIKEEQSLLQVNGEQDLKDHIQRFCWMKNVGFFEEYYTEALYQERLHQMKERQKQYAQNKEERERHQHLFLHLLEKVSDDKFLSSIIKTANEAVYFRSYRTEMFYSSPCYNQALLKEVGKRLGLAGYRDFVWLYWDEIYTRLKDKGVADYGLIRQRKEHYVFLSGLDREYEQWSGSDAKRVYEVFKSQEELQTAKEITGQLAYPGKVRGRVAIVQHVGDMSKVKEGDILVTHSTNVHFIPLLKKVAAIVTEEGGILSHASIISRELRIPCIIGAKMATKVLLDGDMVDVDATTGRVKKVS